MRNFKHIYPVLEALTWSLCQKNGIPKSEMQNIIQKAIARINPNALNNKKKADLITDFRRKIKEEIMQLQRQD